MIEKQRAKRIYQNMNRIRCFEMKAVSLFESNKLRGSVHLYVGEEAVAATVCSRLSDEDYIASTHRGHGHCIAKGAALDRAMAELMGKATGYCKGRSGSCISRIFPRAISAPTLSWAAESPLPPVRLWHPGCRAADV